jgi:hypothetical protein
VRFTTASPDAVRTAAVKPAPVNSLKRSSAFKSASAFFASKLCRVSPVRIHNDLCGHRNSPLQGTGILRAVSTSAQTQQRARGKLTVSEQAYR